MIMGGCTVMCNLAVRSLSDKNETLGVERDDVETVTGGERAAKKGKEKRAEDVGTGTESTGGKTISMSPRSDILYRDRFPTLSPRRFFLFLSVLLHGRFFHMYMKPLFSTLSSSHRV